MKKDNSIYFILSLIFLLCFVFVFYLNNLITERKIDEYQLKKEIVHQRAVDQFSNSIENFATFVASLSAFIDSQPAIPPVEELQYFINRSLEKNNFNDSIVISYLDTTHTFLFMIDRNSINKHDLVGTNVRSIRDEEEIQFLNNIMKHDKLQLNTPINLVEGWLGIPLVFGVKKEGISVGYVAPIINFSTIINSVYNNMDTAEFLLKFSTGDGLEFDRGAIYDGTTIYNTYEDPEYYRKHEIVDSFLTSNISMYGYDFKISTSSKKPKVNTYYQRIQVFGFLFIIGVFLFYVSQQHIKNRKINAVLNESKLHISKQNVTLKQTQEKYTNMLTNVGDGVFEIDGDGELIYINHKMLEMLNMEFKDIRNTNLWDMTYAEDIKEMRDFYIAQFKQLKTNCYYEFRLKRSNKPPLWVEQNTTMQYEGSRMVRLQSVVRDISRTKKLQSELAEKESLFQLVSENSSDLIALHELDGTYRFVSPSSIDLLGYDPDELRGKSPYSFIHPEDVEIIQKGPHHATLNGEGIQEVEYRMQKKNGEYIWLESYTKPIFDQTGTMVSFQTSSRDITEKRKEREQLQKSKVKAEQASIAKDHFLSMMSHEIRTPLNGIIGTTHLLLSKDPRENQKSHLNILKQSSDNLLAIVNDILDFNKIEEGKIELDNSTFDLKELVSTIHNNYLIQASEKNVNVTLLLDDLLADLYMGDPVRISQILHNLMNNALKFTEKGHVSLTLKRTNQHDNYDEIYFEVSDTGIGIPASKLKTVFNEFEQTSKSTSTKYGGSGLGLAITKRLLELMESKIHLESTLKEGSTFSFKLILPRKTAAVSHKKPTTFETFSPLDATVLIVEDNLFNRVIANEFLVSWGCTTREAINGEKAIEMLEKMDVDIVLMDLQMPVMDGFEAVKIIRNKTHDYYKELPIIALSAAALGDVRDQVFQSGMNEFITKPFLPAEFYTKLAYQLKKNRKHTGDENIIYQITQKLTKTLGHETGLERFVSIFANTADQESKLLKQHIDNQSLNDLKVYAHKNHSSFKMVGLDKLVDQAIEIESMIVRKSPKKMILQKARHHYKDLMNTLNQLKKAL